MTDHRSNITVRQFSHNDGHLPMSRFSDFSMQSKKALCSTYHAEFSNYNKERYTRGQTLPPGVHFFVNIGTFGIKCFYDSYETS